MYIRYDKLVLLSVQLFDYAVLSATGIVLFVPSLLLLATLPKKDVSQDS